MVNDIFLILTQILQIYSFVLVIRILLTWIPDLRGGKATYYLSKITDPYINIFRRFRFTRIGMFDLSAIISIMVLYIFIQIFYNISQQGIITISMILSIIIDNMWNTVAGFLSIISLVLIIRALFLFLKKNIPLFYSFDLFTEPRIRNFIMRFSKKFYPYRVQLIIFAVFLMLCSFAGNLAMGFLTNFIEGLNF